MPTNRIITSGQNVLCIVLGACLCLCASASPSQAVTMEKITSFSGKKDPDISFRKSKIEFYGVTIDEQKESIKASYNKKVVFKQDLTHLISGKYMVKEAVVALDYPEKGMKTLVVGIFTGGASCCMSDLLLTKTPDGLTLTTIDENRGASISLEDIKNDKPLHVSNPCVGQLDLQKVADEFFWPASMVPRPETYLVPENGTWRYAKPKEFEKPYAALLAEGMKPYLKAAAQKPGKDDDLGQAYADAVELVYYAVMAGKTDAECDAVLHTILPNLAKEKRTIFLKELKVSMETCEALRTTKLQ